MHDYLHFSDKQGDITGQQVQGSAPNIDLSLTEQSRATQERTQNNSWQYNLCKEEHKCWKRPLR